MEAAGGVFVLLNDSYITTHFIVKMNDDYGTLSVLTLNMQPSLLDILANDVADYLILSI